VLLLAGVLHASLLLAGCLDRNLPAEDQLDGGAARVFIAGPSDFRHFQDWTSFELSEEMHAGAGGPVVVYINELPESGAHEFPVGTVIVKAVESGKPSAWTIHAMAKRGGQFNPQGAFDWEFFEIGFYEDQPVIVWREKPPNGEGYKPLGGGTMKTETDCNSCHKSSKNDAVLTPELDLGAF
jgi:hypothetical protein